MANGQSTHPEADAVIFSIEGGSKSWRGRRSTNQMTCLLQYLTGVTTRKFQQTFQNGTIIPV